MNNINYYPYYGYYGYWHKRYVNLIMNNPPVEEVYNPDTGEKLNIKNLLREFISNIENKQIDKVLEKYEKMSTFFKLSDNVDRQLKKLKDIYEYTGFSKEFEKQLEIVYNYLIKEEQKYIPISDKYFELYSNLKTQSKGISFLCPTIDELTNGIMPGTICTICGNPGSMKTTLAMNICYQAIKDGNNVCYITLEESPTTLFSKLLSRVSVEALPTSPIKASDIINHTLNDMKKKQLFEEVKPFMDKFNGKIHIIGESDITDYTPASFEKVIEKANKNVKEKTGKSFDLIVIDHIQLLKFSESDKDEKETMNQFISFFRKMSLSFLDENKEIAIILLSQVNREGIAYSQRKNGSYLLQHVAEASELERASTYIITTYVSPEHQISKLIKVGTLKLRNAPLLMDTVNVFADGEYYQVGQTSTPEQTEYTAADLGLDDNTPINQSISDASLDSIFAGIDLL